MLPVAPRMISCRQLSLPVLCFSRTVTDGRIVVPRSICNVSATSQETLQGHAAGMKHKRRVRVCQCLLWPLGPQHDMQFPCDVALC